MWGLAALTMYSGMEPTGNVVRGLTSFLAMSEGVLEQGGGSSPVLLAQLQMACQWCAVGVANDGGPQWALRRKQSR